MEPLAAQLFGQRLHIWSIGTWDIGSDLGEFLQQRPVLRVRCHLQTHCHRGHLVWTISWGNCSGTLDQITSRGTSRVVFTTKNGKQQPNLVAATADDTCTSSESFTFNMTGTLSVGYPPDYDDRTLCAVLAPTLPTPAPNPRGTRVDASVASSISSALTSRACAGATNPLVSCPPTPTGKSSGPRGAQFPVRIMAWLTVFGWLLKLLVLY